jgi:hypothetical protein
MALLCFLPHILGSENLRGLYLLHLWKELVVAGGTGPNRMAVKKHERPSLGWTGNPSVRAPLDGQATHPSGLPWMDRQPIRPGSPGWTGNPSVRAPLAGQATHPSAVPLAGQATHPSREDSTESFALLSSPSA